MSVKPLGGFNTSLQQVDERYGWINDMIASRQELVLKYMQLLQLDPNAETSDEELARDLGHEQVEYTPSAEQVSDFCDHLIDYISHGHFDLYPKIVELIENASGRSLSIARRVMPRIEKTTEVLMQFNDRYSEYFDESRRKSLRKDLAVVGEYLEQRFRNEDRLIIGLRLVHTIVSSI